MAMRPSTRARARGGFSSGGGFHDPFDIFRDVFGGGGGGSIFENLFGGGQDPNGPQRGDDLRYDMQISLEEAALGCEKEISVTKPDQCDHCHGAGAEPGSKMRQCGTCGGRGQVLTSRGIFSIAQTCPHCKGAGRILEKPCKKCSSSGKHERTSKIKLRIPAGVESGSRLRSSGSGEAGAAGGTPGDLYVVLTVKEHELFERQGDDLFCELPIKFTLATMGGTIEVPTLFGKASLKIPSGTQSGTTFRLRDKGMPSLRSGRQGDQLVRIHVEVPTSLTSEQRRLLEEFARVGGAAAEPTSKSFFEKAKKFF